MEYSEQQFIKGFNGGYLLAQHEPLLLSQITKTLEPRNDYLLGFISGKKEYENENQKIQLEDLSKLRDKGLDMERE